MLPDSFIARLIWEVMILIADKPHPLAIFQDLESHLNKKFYLKMIIQTFKIVSHRAN